MNFMTGHNARRIKRDSARINDLLDYLSEHPNASQAKMLKDLARLWKVSERTARIPLEYCKRHKLIHAEKVTIWRIK